MGSDMILADLHEGNLAWKREWSTYSFTSGPKSPTKIEYSGPRSSRLRSARPPPEAQFSLKGRFEFAIGVPLSVMALAAAAALWKSMKQ